MADVFVSYNREDQSIAQRFAKGFEREGFSVWWMPTLRSGDTYDTVTEKALREAMAVAVLWSRNSVESQWVRAEATIAARSNKLVPAMVDVCDRPVAFELTQAAELTHWKGNTDDPAWRAYVSDVRGVVERSKQRGEAQTGGDERKPPQAAREVQPHKRRLGPIPLTIMALAVPLAIALIFVFRHGSAEDAKGAAAQVSPAKPVSVAAAQSAAPAASVAVVPFANLTGEPAKEYFSDGMAEELINALAKVPGLNVASRVSSFAYKGKSSDIRQIARELNVATVLEGSVRSAGDRVRVTAELVDAKSGYHLWAESYDRKFTDLFTLQEDLAREIVTAFKTKVSVDVTTYRTEGPPTKDVEAYRLYLQAVSAYNRASEAGAREAIELVGKAVARDPGFARAYLLRASALTLLPLTNVADIERDARRAIALDPRIGDDALLAQVEARRGNWVAAESMLTALSADSREPGFHNYHALATLWPLGHVRAALAEFTESYRLAPAAGFYSANLARAESNLGQDAEAIEHVKAAVTLGVDPGSRRVTQIYVDAADRAGRYGEAADLVIAMLPEHLRSKGGAEAVKLVYTAIGEPARRKAASSALAGLLSRLTPDDWVVQVYAMGWYTQLGSLDAAYAVGEELRQRFARDGQSPVNAWSWLWSPQMHAFRRDARFAAFVARLGMVEYWQKYGPPDDCELSGGKLVCR